MTCQTYLLCHSYKFFFTLPHSCYNLILLEPTCLPISTSFSWNKSFMYYIWAKQAVCFNCRLTKKDYLQINAFPDLMVIKQEEYPHALLKKPLRESQVKWWEKWLARCGLTWLSSWDINISFNYWSYYLISKSDSRIVIDKWWAW